MPSFARAYQNGHPENRIVRYTSGVANRGFLLTRNGYFPGLRYWAQYVDNFTEQINPPQGSPRPTPDPAVRTRAVSLPPSFIATDSAGYKLASRFTGQMRKVVQCDYSRGTETRFSHTWARSHGLLEFPFEHTSGRDAYQEADLRAHREYFVVEVSPAGVFAAPVEFGANCLKCAIVTSYMLRGRTELDLAAYYEANPTGPVQRVLTAQQIAPAYAVGSPWYSGCGWAFSYSGRRASNVCALLETQGYTYYRTTRFEITFGVKVDGEQPATIHRQGKLAVVTRPGHGFVNGQLVYVHGADQPEYNGIHVAKEAGLETFKFDIAETAPSPATGPIRIASAASRARVSAALSKAEEGRVLFKRGGGGTLWLPESPGVWRGVPPPVATQSVSGPVHVFYDGEEPIITRWSSQVEDRPEEQIAPPGIARWDGGAAGVHSHPTEPYSVPVVQNPNCVIEGTRHQLEAGGSFVSRRTVETFGFHGPFDARVTAFSRSSGEAQSSVQGIDFDATIYNNNYALCGGGNGSGLIERVEHIAYVQNIITRRDNETQGGGSALILLAEEREAVAAVQTVRTTAQVEKRAQGAVLRTRVEERLVEGDGPFTAYELDTLNFIRPAPELAMEPVVSQSVENSAFVQVRGAGGFAYNRALPITYEGDLLGSLGSFQTFALSTKETATSDLFFMRGGLWYDEPALQPKNQRGNRVFKIDGDVQTQGGFRQLTEGRDPIAFIGEV